MQGGCVGCRSHSHVRTELERWLSGKYICCTSMGIPRKLRTALHACHPTLKGKDGQIQQWASQLGELPVVQKEILSQ